MVPLGHAMLNLNYGNRVERLADSLLERLAQPGGDPLSSDWVVVAQAAMGRWLAQRKAARDGICANVEFLYPAAAIWRLLRAARPELPLENPFRPEALTLRVLESFGTAAEVPGLEPLAKYLAGQDDLGRYRLARRLADGFDQCLVFRPDWIVSWEEGAEPHWQAVLWRLLAAPGEWHWARCWQWLRTAGEQSIAAARLPSRLSVFAVPELSPSYLDCLARFAARMDVELYQWSPSRHYWGDAASPRARRSPASADGNPLLPSLGLSLRDMLDWLLEWPAQEREDFVPAPAEDLLSRLQNSLLDYHAPPTPETVAETNLEVHVCASRRREIEVCYDRLQAMFEADPGLKAEDVAVVSPQIGVYLPYVRAIFSAIPWRVHGADAERGRGVVQSLAALLKTLSGPELDRSLLELLTYAPIRRRFGLRSGNLADVRRWAREGGFYGGGDGKFSWVQGARRLLAATLLGAPAESWPSAEHVHGSEAEPIGRLLDFLDALLRLHHEVQQIRSLVQWAQWGRGLVARCIKPIPADEGSMRAVRQGLWRISERAKLAGCERSLEFSVFRELLQAELELAAAQRAGAGPGVSFASFSARRLIPARVIYALGLNEGEFPAPRVGSDLDLIAAAPRRGDRSRRLEDRQVFLEWLGSARTRLVLSYVGTDARDGADLAASPLVVELLDHLDGHYRIDAPGRSEPTFLPSASVVTRHPVQPFSGRYGREPGLVSYADHLQITAGAGGEQPFQVRPLTAIEQGIIEAGDLVDFLRLPARHYLRRTLGIWLDIREDLLPVEPPVELDALSRYRLVERLLRDPVRTPATLRAEVDAAVAIPEGPPGTAIAAALAADVAQLRQRHRQFTGGRPEDERRVELVLGSERLHGRVDRVFPAGRVVLHAGAIRGKHLLDLWVNHLLLNLAGPTGGGADQGRTSLLIASRKEAALQPVVEPASVLADLVSVYRAGARLALPFFPDASRAFAERAQDRRRARREARKSFEPDRRRPYTEGANPYVKLAFREQDWQGERFEALAVQIWTPLLAHLEERSSV